MTPPTLPTPPILFYDGQCGLCDRTVRWCLDHDRRGILRFAPLQGSTYQQLTIPNKPTEFDSLMMLDGDRFFTHSNGVLRFLSYLGGPWPLMAKIGRVIPRPIRDALYRWIARRRLRWLGGSEACRLPTREDRSRLLP